MASPNQNSEAQSVRRTHGWDRMREKTGKKPPTDDQRARRKVVNLRYQQRLKMRRMIEAA